MFDQTSLTPAATAPRAAIHGRYSSNMQRPASLEDQERNCRKYAELQGWVVVDEYVRHDAAKTGRTLRHRDALESLIADAQVKPRPFDVLIVDEQSRLARKLKDILEIAEILKHYGVKLYVVNKGLDSDDPNFQTLLTLHGMVDEQNREQTRHRVLRGQEGRVLRGYTSGSRCFGYRSVPVVDISRPDLQGRAGILGVKWEIIESEAATIRRIHELFADGLSVWNICTKLNQEKVPAARKPRIGTPETFWNSTLVKRILQNDKYVGRRIWNKTTQVLHPVTGLTETRKRSPGEWVHTEVAELRIVSDELRERVLERLEIVNKKVTRARLGGLNRAKRRDYLFSGLLFCGVCGSRITIGVSNTRYAAYSCVSARYKHGCTNALWIREDRLTSQLVGYLADHLLVPKVLDYFVNAVSFDLDSYLKQIAHQEDIGSFEALKAKESSLKIMTSRLIDAIMAPGSAQSTALPEKLAEVEAELARTRMELGQLDMPQDLASANLDIAGTLNATVSRLLEIIKQDVPKARQVLQRHIERLILVPIATDDGPAYEVTGELDLFKSSTDSQKRILLARSGIRTVQQYKGHVDFLLRFAGVIAYSKIDAGPNPLLGPLEKVLRADPTLLHMGQLAIHWMESIKSVLPIGAELHGRCNADYVAWNFRQRSEVFVEQFGMVPIKIGRDTYYMFSRAGVDRCGIGSEGLPTLVVAA